MTECPNCGSLENNELNLHDDMHCVECGTVWHVGREGQAVTPRRSQPPEVVSLPTCDGQWLFRGDGKWRLIHVYGVFYWGCRQQCERGEWIRFVQPIPPPQKRDEDADWRERVSHYMCEAAKLSVKGDLQEAIHAVNFAVGLLADYLEKGGAK